MNMLKKFVAAAVCSLAFGSANAALITINEEKVLDHEVTKSSSTGMAFDLNSQLAGYGVNSMDILSGYLYIFLLDSDGGQERYSIAVGNGASLQTVVGTGMNHVPNGNDETKLDIVLTNALLDLQADGMLNVGISLTSNQGSFYVMRGQLFASFEEPVRDVPEPVSAALLGLGLLCVQAARRRRA